MSTEEEQTLARLQRFEARLDELLGIIGTVDPSSERMALLLAECSSHAAELEDAVALLSQAAEPARERALQSVRRLVRLNALASRAVEDEQRAAEELLARTRAVSASLALVERPETPGDSCDVRG